jgi:hypothetical protein
MKIMVDSIKEIIRDLDKYQGLSQNTAYSRDELKMSLEWAIIRYRDVQDQPTWDIIVPACAEDIKRAWRKFDKLFKEEPRE